MSVAIEIVDRLECLWSRSSTTKKAIVSASAALALVLGYSVWRASCTRKPPQVIRHLDMLVRVAESLPSPCALVDVSVLHRNVDKMVATVLDTTVPAVTSSTLPPRRRIRVHTKSTRCVSVINEIISRIPQGALAGLMTFSAEETYRLMENDELSSRVDHFLLSYPVADECAADTIVLCAAKFASKGRAIAIMVDDVYQLRLVERAMQRFINDPERKVYSPKSGREVPPPKIRVWLDIDMSWRPFSLPSVHVGVRRSPLRSHSDLLKLVKRINESDVFELEGIMGYEAQVAGLGDHPSTSGVLSSLEACVRGVLKHFSVNDAAARRGDCVRKLALAMPKGKTLQCNGGGSGSLATTSSDPSVTEVTIGSGALCGHLFDHYQDLSSEPALFFALRITRQPARNILTCHGGGWLASGSGDKDRLPLPVWPQGATLLGMEGAGEVQTPIMVPRVCDARIGDIALFRPAKSGELAEVLQSYYLLFHEKGKACSVRAAKTFRGAGVHAWSPVDSVGEHRSL